MKDPRQDPNRTLIRAWGMLHPEEREALVEYFSEPPSVKGLAETLTKWTDAYFDELRAEKAAIKPGSAASNILQFKKKGKK